MAAATRSKRIWIDTDIIFNIPGEEVDDGLALMMALNTPDIDIAGISLIHNVDNGYKATRQLLDYYARGPIPVYKGANDATQGAGAHSQAVEQLAAALGEGELTVVAIGPATNIANLLAFYPEAAANIKDIVFCAGRQTGVAFTTPGSRAVFPDYNFDMDPASLRRVIASHIPVTLSGYEAAANIFLYQEDIEAIKDNGRAGDAWVYDQLKPRIDGWKQMLDITGFIPFDTCTIGHVLHPGYFYYYRDIPVAVETRENDSKDFLGMEEKPYLEVSYAFDSAQKVDFVHKTKPEYKYVVMNDLLGWQG